jgi:hypothetical protein
MLGRGFYDAGSNWTTYMASNSGMTDEWWIQKCLEESDRGLVQVFFFNIYLERLKKITKIVSQETGVATKIRTVYLRSTNLECCRYGNFLSLVSLWNRREVRVRGSFISPWYRYGTEGKYEYVALLSAPYIVMEQKGSTSIWQFCYAEQAAAAYKGWEKFYGCFFKVLMLFPACTTNRTLRHIPLWKETSISLEFRKCRFGTI